MRPPTSARHPWKPSSRTLLALFLAVAAAPAVPAAAQTCDRSGCGRIDCATPARPAPANRWGDLQAVDPNPLPAGRDASAFNEFREPYARYSWYMSVDAEGRYLIAGLSHGIEVWDTSPNPASPTLVGRAVHPERGTSPFPVWVDSPEQKWPFQDVDAPAGTDTVAALVGEGGLGIAVMNLSNKSAPQVAYQNHRKDGEQVYAATIGGTHYAFVAAKGSAGGGLFVFNMSRALQYNRCVEAVPAAGEPVNCPGVYVGMIGTRNPALYVDGVDEYVVVSSGAGRGFEIWNVANPAAPQLKLQAFTGKTGMSVYGVALWKEGSNYYLGLRNDNQGRIYDVSCITGTCSGLGNPLWTQAMDSGTPNFFVTFSRSGQTPFLYFGSDNKCAGSSQREWLFDVSNPANPHDLSPPNYWTWYYRGSDTGFNQVMPRAGKFIGEHFYRAGLSIMDIHKRTGGLPPTVDFSWAPSEVYRDDPVDFQDLSLPLPTTWSWSFQDGSPATSASRNPLDVTFSTLGPKTITLTAANAIGPAVGTKTLTVLDPAPAVASVSSSPTPSALVCQPVTFTANGVTGRPALTYSWQVLDGNDMVVAGPVDDDNTFVWTSPPGIQPGAYKGKVTVSNASGTVSVLGDVTINGLTPLPTSFAPTNDPFTAGMVQFKVDAAGATEWNWDFGDGAGYTGWTSDPVNGPKPTKAYTTIGQKNVRVMVRNCVETAGRESSVLTIDILVVTPLVAGFQATTGAFCSGLGCFGTTGVPITFEDQSSGAQIWDYDWDGNGSYEDAGHTAPVTAHTYASAGTFAPKQRVKRGASEEKVFTHKQIIVGGPGGGGGGGGGGSSISISGPSSGTPGQSLSFSASASGCSAAATGWTWNVSGGSISGAANTSSISVSWASEGSKTLQASNSGCGSTTGSKAVAISSGGGGGGGGGTLQAAFTFTPPAPNPGETVSFNGSSSTGSPAGYSWTFGDGGNASGSAATHAYATAGSYPVKLTVTKPGSGPGCFSGICASELTKVVVVGGGGGGGGTILDPAFEANAECINIGGFDQCQVQTGVEVTLTAASTTATSFAWDFGDGTTGSGKTVTHSWTAPGPFTVKLTVGDGTTTAMKTRLFQVSGDVVSGANSVVLPWIAQTRGALVQSSDLYVHNPGSTAIEVALEFRKRGNPEPNPPRVTREVKAGETLFFADVLRELFDRENIAGFISIEVLEGNVEPVITSFNTTFQGDEKFGQTIPGISMSRRGAAASAVGPAFQHLVGLNDTDERSSYFGVSNPSGGPVTYRLRFHDKDGEEIGTSKVYTLSRYGQKQFQPREIREELGVADVDDYRVQVETVEGGPLFPYGANVRNASEDPSFVGVGTTASAKLYLIGALSTPGLQGSQWQSDVVLSNTTDKVILTDMTFLRVGFNSDPEQTVNVTLQPGETRRLANVVSEEWGVDDAVGILVFDSDSQSEVFPVIQGESYDNSHPARKFGQSMAAFTESDVAGPGQGHYLAGLRQEADYRTTLWLYNPSDQAGLYDLLYRKLDGTVLGRLDGVTLGGGKARQIRPSDHPIPTGKIADGFTVQVLVRTGTVLAAGQVVNNATNDPAYISGEKR